MGNTNLFLTATKSHDIRTENGALSNSSTGLEIIDQFGLAGNYRGRDFNEVAKDQCALWDENPLYAVRFPFYLRLVTRKTKINEQFVTDSVQKGQGSRDEAFKRLLWLAREHSQEFYDNIWLLPCVGRWKDIWDLMYYDKTLGLNVVNHEVMFSLLLQGLALKGHCTLVKKYMPRIRSNQKCHTEWAKVSNELAKEFAKFINMDYRAYNKFKATINGWQQQMCARKFDEINFSTIPGKALSNLVSSKFLANHSLTEKYMAWLDKRDAANFTGYVYELANKWLKAPRQSDVLRNTINKQFKTIVDQAKDGQKSAEKVWVAIDTSASMGREVANNLTALELALSLGIFFSTMIEGSFHKNVIMFDEDSRVKQLSGEFCDMVEQFRGEIAMGCTEFMSICKTIVKTRLAHPEIPLSDYPTAILVVSDMQFDSTEREVYSFKYHKYMTVEATNYETFKDELSKAFPKEFVDNFKFIWWNCASAQKDFPAQVTDGGCYFFSGFDGSILSMLLGDDSFKDDVNQTERPSLSMEELVQKALSQEILEQITVGK